MLFKAGGFLSSGEQSEESIGGGKTVRGNKSVKVIQHMNTYLFFTLTVVDDSKLKALVEAKLGGWLPEHNCGFISGENKDDSSLYVRIREEYPESLSPEIQEHVVEQIGLGQTRAIEVKVGGSGDDINLLHEFYYAMYYCWKGFLWNGEIPEKQMAG